MKSQHVYLGVAVSLFMLGVLGPPMAGTAAAQTLTPEQKAAIEAKKKKAQQQPKPPSTTAQPKVTPKPAPKVVQPKPVTKPTVVQPKVTKPPVATTQKPVAKPVPKVTPPAVVKKVTPPVTKPVTPSVAKPATTPGVTPPVATDKVRKPFVRKTPLPGQTVTQPERKSVNPAFPTPNQREGNPGLPSVAKTPTPPPAVVKPVVKPVGPANLEALKSQRKEIVAKRGNAVVIKEPDKRTIVKKDGKAVIVHDEANRLQRVTPNAKVVKEGRNNVTIIDRPNNVQIYNITDSNGQLVKRYRRDADGRETVIIDNESRRRKSRWGRNLAIGLGVGAGIVAGAAILNAVADVPPPRVDVERRKYIVDYEDADDEEVYEAFSAPPVDRIQRRYTLDEVRATPALRDRMRRVDLNDINFDSGSWEVDESQYNKLERVARALKRVIERDPNEVFMIEGYTDAVGSEEDNLTLSDRRAESVAVILSEQFEVPAENITTQGYGEQYLKVPTDGPERANRRVAIRRITPLISQQDDRR